MSEVKTAPLVAQHIPDKDAFADEYWRGKVPGSFRVDEPDDTGEQTFWYCCPCGCGSVGPLTVGVSAKPASTPSWAWNGSLEKPTLQPSVHHVGHWHGFLIDGIWTSA